MLFDDKGEPLETQSVKSGGLETIEEDLTTGGVRLSDRGENVEAGKVTGVDFMVTWSSGLDIFKLSSVSCSVEVSGIVVELDQAVTP